MGLTGLDSKQNICKSHEASTSPSCWDSQARPVDTLLSPLIVVPENGMFLSGDVTAMPETLRILQHPRPRLQ